ncbi:MAG: hypothetical protein D6675_11585 [Gemmatimonadetes bacterium]|nr:MAG: hypothetical protein D6675_11585 [Gemmatimonadota bacterium]
MTIVHPEPKFNLNEVLDRIDVRQLLANYHQLFHSEWLIVDDTGSVLHQVPSQVSLSGDEKAQVIATLAGQTYYIDEHEAPRVVFGAALKLWNRNWGFVVGTSTEPVEKVRLSLQMLSETLIYRLSKEFEIENIAQELLGQYEHLELLHDISYNIVSHLDIPTTTQFVLEKAIEIIDAEDGALLLFEQYNSEKNLYIDSVSSYQKRGETLPEQTRHGLDETVIERLINEGEAIVDNHVEREIFLVNGDPRTRIRSALCIPMKTKESGVLGVVILINKRDTTGFTSMDKKLLITLTTQAGHMLKNAYLFHSLQREKKSIERIMDTTADAIIVTDQNFQLVRINESAKALFHPENNTADPKLAVILYKLETLKAEAAYFDIAFMTPQSTILSVRAKKLWEDQHEPAGWVISFQNITALKEDERKRREIVSFLAQPIPVEAANLIAKMYHLKQQVPPETVNPAMKHAKQIQKQAHRLWNFLQIIAGPLRLERSNINVNRLIETTIEQKSYLFDEKAIRVELQLPDEPLISRIDQDWSQQLIESLLENAIQSSAPHTAVQVQLEGHPSEIVIRVINAGKGVTDEERRLLFDPMQQLEAVEQMHWDEIRMGLPFAKHIVDAHGGTLHISSIEENPDECIVEVVLPHVHHF